MSKVKQHFTSRFKDGQLVNADLSQIEVRLLAQASKDSNLIALFNADRDIYKYFAALMYLKPEKELSKEERSDLKPLVLGMGYGKAAHSFARETGKTVEWCQEFIDTFYREFPKTRLWHDFIIDKVDKNKGKLITMFKQQLQFHKYVYINSKKIKYDSLIHKGLKGKYARPDIKNWPIQSSAHILMSLLLGEFYRQFGTFKRDKYLLINTVHDSLMLDCKKEFVEEANKDIQEIVDRIPDLVYNKFNIKLLVPIKIDISNAVSWYDL